jgi:hypothetical protein
MKTIGSIVATIHNAWLRLPAPVREALGYSVAILAATLIAMGKAFAWTIPDSPAAAWSELVAFATIAAPVLMALAVVLVRSKVAPAVISWFLGAFGYIQASAKGAQPPRADLWKMTPAFADKMAGRWLKT